MVASITVTKDMVISAPIPKEGSKEIPLKHLAKDM